MHTIRPASPETLAPLGTLLTASDLPAGDLAPAHMQHFLAAYEGETLVGGVGLEPRGEAGLLRSLVVAPGLRGQGLGISLAEAAERKAAEIGLRDLYLLTTTAEGFFAKRGYRVIERSAAPAGMQETVEFREACPATAVCMTRAL